MFDNIGRKLKTLAKVSAVLGIAATVICAFTLMIDEFLAFLLTIVLGSLSSWLVSLPLYGLGQLIENTDELVKQGQKQQGGTQIQLDPPAPTPAEPVPSPTSQSSPLKAFLSQPSAPEDQFDIGNGIVRCPHCKTIQSKQDTCRYCYKPMIPTQK